MAIPPMDENLKQLLSAFNANRVKYVVIGGYAVFVHAQPRMTKDLDVFIESSSENAIATYKGLAEFGAPLDKFTVEDFADGKTVGRFGVPPICFEVIQHIDGVDFDSVYADSVTVMIDGEVPARYISAEHLIANKLASGRPQDLADVAAVRQAQSGKRRPKKPKPSK
ncbi:MAG: nucleotidyltransferase [Acidobacteriaceae bacterium]